MSSSSTPSSPRTAPAPPPTRAVGGLHADNPGDGPAWARSPRVRLAAAILLGALVGLAYAPFLSTGFAATDSLPLVETSRFATLADALREFSRPVMDGTRFTLGEVVYRPLPTLTFGLDHVLWGLNPAGYHLTNTLLHLVAVFAVWLLLRNLGLGYWTSLGGAALFGLHPLVVASVPVIARRDSVLPVAALTLGAALLVGAEGTPRGLGQLVRLGGALGAIAVALFSKESAFAGLGLLPLLLVAAPLARGEPVTLALRSLWWFVPCLALGVAVFAVRFAVLRGLGGSPDGSTHLLLMDLNQYSQTLGAFTRDLAWPIAWLAPSTREVWPRLAAAVAVGLLLAFLCLPRRQGVLAAAGLAWVAAFAVFCMLFKIATVAWLAYFSLVGVALVVAAGTEGAVDRLRTRRRARVAATGAAALLAGLLAYTAASLWASPLVRRYDQWQTAGDVTRWVSEAVTACVASAPEATRLRVAGLPGSFEDGRVETNLMGVTLLEPYTLDAALELMLPARRVEVAVSSFETLRAGADTLNFSCAPLTPDGVELTVTGY